MTDDIDESRRELLVKLLTSGAFMLGTGAMSSAVWGMGKVPKILPPGKSFFDIRGHVTVNNVAANLNTLVKPGDVVATGDSSHAVFVVGKDAFFLRDDSSMEIEGSAIINTIRIFSGRVLSVFGHRAGNKHLSLKSSTATMGIRGTGAYLESDPEKTYFCTCYGAIDIASNVNRNEKTRVVSEHHDAPKYILKKPMSGKLIVPAPMINHTDQELALIESLVGREPPFGIEGDLYSGPRKEY